MLFQKNEKSQKDENKEKMRKFDRGYYKFKESVRENFEAFLTLTKNLLEFNNATFGAIKFAQMYREDTKYAHKNSDNLDQKFIITAIISIIIIALLILCFYYCYF